MFKCNASKGGKTFGVLGGGGGGAGLGKGGVAGGPGEGGKGEV